MKKTTAMMALLLIICAAVFFYGCTNKSSYSNSDDAYKLCNRYAANVPYWRKCTYDKIR